MAYVELEKKRLWFLVTHGDIHIHFIPFHSKFSSISKEIEETPRMIRKCDASNVKKEEKVNSSATAIYQVVTSQSQLTAMHFSLCASIQ